MDSSFSFASRKTFTAINVNERAKRFKSRNEIKTNNAYDKQKSFPTCKKYSQRNENIYIAKNRKKKN